MLSETADLISKVPKNIESRLIIYKIVVENFKSYAGRQEIGPFHKSFSSIVGPNGSGKSNVIDAIMFVLGYRARKMRQTKLSDLIHISEGLTDLESCSVEVQFRHIIDDESSDNYQLVPGSEINVARTAFRNNRSVYTINGVTSNYADITALLKVQGIDLDHKRFLILQGEVEAIAMMKPKGSTENEEGLLEYLEDIIGTNRLIEPIEIALKELDVINEKHAEKLLRVRAAEKEVRILEVEKEEAESYLRQENTLTEKRSQLLQLEIWQAKQDLLVLEKRQETNLKQLTAEREKSGNDSQLAEKLESSLKELKKETEELEKRVKSLTGELAKIEEGDFKLQETRKQLKVKLKNLEKQTNDSEKTLTTLTRSIDDIKQTQAHIERELVGKQEELVTAKGELEKLSASLQGVASQYQDALAKKQAELLPFQDQLREIEREREMTKSELKLLQDQVATGQVEVQRLETALTQLITEEKELQIKKEELFKEEQGSKQELEETQKLVTNLRSTAEGKGRELNMLQTTLSEAICALQEEEGPSSGSAVFKALMKEAKAGRLKGVHGRLGDLGAIDGKYDVAIATACSYLDHIVVDTTDAGQACIEFLRRHNVGRANFIVLEKMRPANGSPKDIPQGAQRLFDLVRVKDSKFCNAMYFALTDTLVAENLSQAQAWAYQANKRWRVVTLDGKLFETSGTISGGGQVKRGGMKAQLPASSGVTEEQVGMLKKKVAEMQQELQEIYGIIKKEEQIREQRKSRLSQIETELIIITKRLNGFPSEISLLEGSLKNKRKQVQPSKATEKEILRLEREVAVIQARVNEQREMARPIENEISAIQQQILDAGGIKYKVQKSRVDGLIEAIENDERRLVELTKEKANFDKRLQALQSGTHDTSMGEKIGHEIARIDEQIKENTNKAIALQTELKEYQSTLDIRSDEVDSLQERLDEIGKAVVKFKKVEYELRVALEQDEEKIDSSKQLVRNHSQQLGTLKLHQLHGEPPSILAIYEDEGDLREMTKTLPGLKNVINTLQLKLSQAHPNLKVLDEYRTKAEIFQKQEEEFAEIEKTRTGIRERYDGLCQQRLDEFMAGFRTISANLKELYELVTMGGNAELEAVDSLNPFSEGILFSVMPPRKSWKPISNLSGGEKTLSSLALVFALHQYRPTPIYVMDEIDAALDFRNVSIIAHYIKERTQGAQFVVVSLRSNMFEMADQLVGIYKTHQRTKSISIDPKRFLIQSIPSPITQTDGS